MDAIEETLYKEITEKIEKLLLQPDSKRKLYNLSIILDELIDIIN